jgi:hypothetical protein
MTANEKECTGCWISFILRVAMASLFLAAAVPKFTGDSASEKTS